MDRKLTKIELQLRIEKLEAVISTCKESGLDSTAAECRKIIRTYKRRIANMKEDDE